ncbi:MAG: DUF2809 domain-containing protein [Verrucomicrobiota bacterium JB025]|nr:DUF2809 domain-containing protein [Verrucomicrobiota bacterium JB025]
MPQPTKFSGAPFVFTRTSTLRLALGALVFCWAVECSQLYHAPWIDAVRSTLPGRLVLGTTFNWPDLAAYAVGVAAGAAVEWLGRRRARVRTAGGSR